MKSGWSAVGGQMSCRRKGSVWNRLMLEDAIRVCPRWVTDDAFPLGHSVRTSRAN